MFYRQILLFVNKSILIRTHQEEIENDRSCNGMTESIKRNKTNPSEHK